MDKKTLGMIACAGWKEPGISSIAWDDYSGGEQAKWEAVAKAVECHVWAEGQAQIDALTERNGGLERDNAKLQFEIEQWKNRVATINKRIGGTFVDALEKRNETLNQEKDALIKSNDSLFRAHSLLQTENDELRKKIESLTKTNRELESEAKHWKDKFILGFSVVPFCKDGVKVGFSSSEREIARLQKEIEDMGARYADLKMEYDRTVNCAPMVPKFKKGDIAFLKKGVGIKRVEVGEVASTVSCGAGWEFTIHSNLLTLTEAEDWLNSKDKK